MQYQIVFRQLSVLAILCFAIGKASAQSIELPELGSSSSSVVSVAQERQLGQAWPVSYTHLTLPTTPYV